MPFTLLFKIAACIETPTGIALFLLPNTVTQLLLGEALSGAGRAVASPHRDDVVRIGHHGVVGKENF